MSVAPFGTAALESFCSFYWCLPAVRTLPVQLMQGSLQQAFVTQGGKSVWAAGVHGYCHHWPPEGILTCYQYGHWCTEDKHSDRANQHKGLYAKLAGIQMVGRGRCFAQSKERWGFKIPVHRLGPLELKHRINLTKNFWIKLVSAAETGYGNLNLFKLTK